MERVKALGLAVQKFFEPNVLRGNQFTPHHVVAAYGSKELYEYIANKTGQIDNRTSNSENKALHFSAHFGNVGVFQFLIENSDDKNPRNIYGSTPLHYAALQENIETKHERLEICKIILAHYIRLLGNNCSFRVAQAKLSACGIGRKHYTKPSE